jgi:chromosome segregation ATPase
MSPGKVKEFILDVDFLCKCLVGLLGVLLALVHYEYDRVTSDLNQKLASIESRVDESEKVTAARTERLVTVENHVTHIKEDLGRLSGDIRSLGDKIDRLIYEQRSKG